jgi:hypothetical protein
VERGDLTNAQWAAANDRGLMAWDVSLDSTIARAHQCAASARNRGDLWRDKPGGVDIEPDDHGLGRSRGGLTTKIQPAFGQGRKPLTLIITARL